MLDTEPTDQSTSTAGTEGQAAAQPAKKAARKAPAKRAPRKAAAKKAAPAVDPAAAVADTVPAVQEPAGASTDQTPAGQLPEQPPAAQAAAAKAPAKKAPRKRAAKKAAPAEPVGTGPAAEGPAGPEPITEQAPTEQAPTEQAPAAKAPAKKAPRKRAAKKAAPAAAEPQPAEAQAAEAQPAEAQTIETEPAAEDAAEAQAVAPVAPAVLFQPPAATPTRRRRATRPAQSPEPDAAAEEQAPAELETSEDGADQPDGAAEQEQGDGPRRRRRRGRRGRGSKGSDNAGDTQDAAEDEAGSADDEGDEPDSEHADEVAEAALSASARRRRRRRRSAGADDSGSSDDDPPNTVVHIRDGRGRGGAADDDGVRGVKGSTRLEAKRQRRRDNRDSGRRRAPILTEAEFLARREAVERVMAVRQTGDRTQIAVLEDDILVEHYVTRASAASAVGNVYLGRVQNVLPSMEAAFIDIGRGRNGVLYAGEVNWDSAGLAGKARSIENALSSGDSVLVQVTKDPIGHKGARLTSQVSLPGRFVVYVPGGGMTGISRKLPDTERSRLKSILKKVVPDEAGVIVRTAAEGASEQDLISDVERLKTEWEAIQAKAAKKSDAPMLLHGEPDLAIRVVRDIFNDDFAKLLVSGSEIHRTLSGYVGDIAPDLADRISLHTAESDLFRDLRVDEQLAKALDRKVWLPSGGSLVIDRTEAMTVVDVNTGKYTGSGGNLEQTVTRNNLEAAEEIVRQLRLRDLGGIVVIDFIDMVLESNRDLVLRRLTECLGRDRTKHQVAEVTSLGLVQMTRKRVGEGLLEAFSEPCEHCHGRGVIVHLEPVERKSGNGANNQQPGGDEERPSRGRRGRGSKSGAASPESKPPAEPADPAADAEKRRAAANAIAAIAAATASREEAVALAESAVTGAAEPAADATPTTDATPAASADEGVPVAAEPGTPAGAGTAAEAAEAPAPARPRRRRAARRPAGPPAATTGTEG
ncbi:MAG TPA: Rne/Rng family ribonuclease [Jatrophihabitans sp.]|nr:Rne/Rng family ribonuclease [Jatrophihabitans sp.]